MGAQNQTINYKQGAHYVGEIVSTNKKMPHGKGTVHFSEGKTFEGQFQNGIAQKGILKIKEQLQYKGETKNGRFTGKGKLKLWRQNIGEIDYEGQFENGELKYGKIRKEQEYQIKGSFNYNNFLSGQGEYYDLQKKVKYSGIFNKSKLEGNSKVEFNNEDSYQGNFKGGFPHQQCIFRSKQLNIEGNFVYGSMEGKCTINYPNGDIYIGELKSNKIHGEGVYKYSNGTVYKGGFYKNNMWGACTIKYPQSSKVQQYEGQIEDGLYNGFGIIYYRNGVIYSGYFYLGHKNGPGFLVYCGKKFQCLYSMDKIIGSPQLLE